jgi:hypothetical protein
MCLSFRLVRNPSQNVVVEISHHGIALPNEFHLLLSAHILYLLFPDNGAVAIPAKLVVDKSMQVIFGCETRWIETILMLIDSPYEIICYPDIESRPRISHNVNGKFLLHPPVSISE